MQVLRRGIFVAAGAVVLSAISPAVSAQTCGGLEDHLHPGDPWPFKNFGRAVGISGDTALVGAMTDNELGTEAGAAYIHRFDGTTWNQTQKLLASDGASWQNFGWDVAVDGTTAVVAALGKVYVYFDIGGTWTESHVLLPADGTPTFGRTVAIHDDVIVVSTFLPGAAWVFRHDGTQWVEEQKLIPSDGGNHNFGEWPALAVHGDFIAVGAPTHPGLNPPDAPPSVSAGAAYIFHYDDQQWIEKQILSPFDVQDPLENSRFGRALDLYGDLLVVSNPNANNFSTFVYRYDALSNEWIEEQQIIPPASALPDGFGRAIAVENETILIGDWLHPDGGAAFLYKQNAEGLWDVANTFTPNPNAWTNFFGRHLALESGRAIIGANGEDQQSGAAYIYKFTPKTGDLDCNGIVNVHDLLILVVDEWGQCADDCPADLNGDSAVDVFDLLILLANWG